MRIPIICAIFLLSPLTSFAFLTNQSASVVIGQTNFTDTTYSNASNKLNTPKGLFVYNGKLFITDAGNNRILIFNSIPTSNGASADIVIGQASFDTGSANKGLTNPDTGSLNSPDNLFIYQGKLFVADKTNNRILIYNSIPASNNANADVVVGHDTFGAKVKNDNNSVTPNSKGFENPVSVATDGTKMFITDFSNQRVLGYNSIPDTNGKRADFVIGQDYFDSKVVQYKTDRTGYASSYGFKNPYDLALLTDKLLVVDNGDNRVMIFSPVPGETLPMVDLIVGQISLSAINQGTSQSNFYNPNMIATDGIRLFISDGGGTSNSNNRVLVFNSIPTENGVNADVVIGQPDFFSSIANYNGITENSLNYINGIFFDGTKLYVSDRGNNRVLIYNDYGMLTAGISKKKEEILSPNSANNLIEVLSCTAVNGAVNLKSIKINKTGEIQDNEISAIKLYRDSDNDGLLNTAVDAQIGTSQTFTNGSVTFSDINISMAFNTKIHILVVADIGNAGEGKTFGIEISDTSCFTVDTSETVGQIPFPLQSNQSKVSGTGPVISNLSVARSNLFWTVIAFATDKNTGNSKLKSAEYFVNTTGQNGTGSVLVPADGAFDNAEETITTNIGISNWKVGSVLTIYVHSKDEYDIWGEYKSLNLGIVSGENQNDMTYAFPNIFNPLTYNKVEFIFENPDNDHKPSIKIYDIKGRLLKTISDGPPYAWYVKDESGSDVETGLYIYQIILKSKVISGKVAVAR